MANSSVPLAERTEIHKSCKTLESVVNILNDYCEAANAIVSLQKKLAKALRESASAKCVAEIPANALTASATIFESIAEVDSKFAKFADKECDGVSAEVKKWFKKLAKEERTHDDKIASANQKIKQAGQIYERKVKKNPRDAADEHTRYMNLLSTLGPEVNKEKYNHAVLVAQKHTATMYSLAASLSRVADAEWMRGCETVRRFSPTVGQLGQWKALCEGGWAGAIPPDLPDGNAPDASETSNPTESKELDSDDVKDNVRDPPTTLLEKPAPEYTSRNSSEHGSRAVTPSGQSPVPPPQYFPPTPAAEPPVMETGPNPKTTRQEAEDHDGASSVTERSAKANERSATIDAFPAPPTHFPTPPMGGSRFGSKVNLVSSSTPTDQDKPQREVLNPPEPTALTPFPRFAESPTPESALSTPVTDEPRPSAARPDEPYVATASSNAASPETDDIPRSILSGDREMAPASSSYSPTTYTSRSYASPDPSRSLETERAPSSTSKQIATPSPSVPSSYRRGDYMNEAEFGARRSVESPGARTVEPSLGKVIEPSDTGRSNGSVVAALRDRYSRGPGPVPTSPSPGLKSPTRELPKLPKNVSALANRYEPAPGVDSISRQPTGSPSREKVRTSVDTYHRMPEPSATTLSTPSQSRYSAASSPSPTMDEIALRRRRIEELEELELREREHELRMKEREIEHRARELERERFTLMNARDTRNDGYIGAGSRAANGPRLSTTQRPSMDAMPGSRYPSSYSQSATHLVPPASSQASSSSRTGSSQPSSPASQLTDHAPYCGCETCSASKYKSRNGGASPRDLRPPEPLIQLRPEKPKGGWIRRLSMPVIPNAFSLDSKKGGAGIAGGGHGSGAGYRNSMAFAEEDGRLQLHTDLTGGIRNRSSTNISRR